MLQSAFTIVAVIFLMIGLGFLMQAKGWFGANASTVISRVTLRIGMPALVVSNILGQYSRQMLLEGAYSLIVPLVVLGGTYLFSAPVARWAHIPKGRIGVFRALFSFGNTVFLGMPVCLAIFGEGAATVVLFWYLINTTLWWLVGAPNVAKDGGQAVGSPLKRIASPPLVACLVSTALVLLGVKLPEIVMTTADYLGRMVTPLSMLFIGCVLQAMVKRGLKWQKGYGVALAARFLLGPAICLPICLLMNLPPMTLGVFFLQGGMPSQTQSSLWAQETGADAEYAAGGIALSTLAGLLAIPAYAWILTLI
ncbi:MAG: AEC family transporter [Oscillospiraceae bacterium]|jgi:predicted permease|nr:AEC family transporter [Oscillospiraceae bacterium]